LKPYPWECLAITNLQSNVAVRWFGLEVVSLEQENRIKKIDFLLTTNY